VFKDAFSVPHYCDDDATAFALPDHIGGRLAIMVPISGILMTTFGLVSFKLGRHTLSGFLMILYFVIVGSFAMGFTCVNWTSYVDFVLFTITYITLIVFWSRPAFLQPGGSLQKLMYARVKNTTGADVDTIMYGKPSDYDFTYGQLIYIAMYLLWCAVHFIERFQFYTGDGDSATRAVGRAIAHVALRFHWFAEVSGGRYTVLWACTGMSYERLLSLHKIAGRMFLPLILVHMVCNVASFEEHKDVPGHMPFDPFVWSRVNATFGFLAFVMLLGLIATSIPSWRRNHFENFYWNHFNFKFLMMVMLLLHMRQYVFPFSITLVLCFYFDMTFRFISKVMYTCNVESAETVCMDDATNTEVVKVVISRSTWPGGPWDHEAGDYVMLSFGSKNKAAQPITKWLNALTFKETTPMGGPPLPPALLFHPYTISSPPNAASNKFTIYIKNMGEGQWSDQVCKMFREGSGCDIKLVNPHVGGLLGRLSIKPAEYETVVLCAGGIGVTPMCAIWSDIAKKHTVGLTKKVVVLWSAPTTKLFAAFQEFIDLTNQCKTGVEFEFKLFATKEAVEAGVKVDGRGVAMQYGKRPVWQDEIEEAVGAGYTGVFACGPQALMSDVTGAVVSCNKGGAGATVGDTGAKGAKGRVHLHKETFEF